MYTYNIRMRSELYNNPQYILYITLFIFNNFECLCNMSDTDASSDKEDINTIHTRSFVRS